MGEVKKKRINLRLSYNSPVILGFSFACLIILVIDLLTNHWATSTIFSVGGTSLSNPMTYIRFFTHVLGHANWAHFFGNITLILVIGPLLEEKYGSSDILLVILVTAFVTGVVHYFFFPGTVLLGASGVVFAFILLASLTKASEGEIPITFILVFLIYIGEEIYKGIVIDDNVSNLTHILGGITGSVMGKLMNKRRRRF
ncbi:MAG: rhomboid family intramembrane serine protease [Lachnospiraceae bacterium]|nr:rhomboid family intramembrane serine protease [Lachnospiraceae bacterium]